MSVSKCCGARVDFYHDGYFHEVSCSRCGQELSDTEVVDEHDFIDGDGEDD